MVRTVALVCESPELPLPQFSLDKCGRERKENKKEGGQEERLEACTPYTICFPSECSLTPYPKHGTGLPRNLEKSLGKGVHRAAAHLLVGTVQSREGSHP